MSTGQLPEHSQNKPLPTSAESLSGLAVSFDTTLQVPEDSIDRFEAEYPEELPARLEWLEIHLGIDRYRLLRLMGLSGENATASANLSWPEIARRFEVQADRVEHLLTHYLSYFRYETEEAVRFGQQLSERIRIGEIDLADYIASYRADASAAERQEALLAAIVEEGPDLLLAMTSFLVDLNLWQLPVHLPAIPEPRQVV